MGSLREERYLPMVRRGLRTTFTPTEFKTRRILSDTFWIYGKVVKAEKECWELGEVCLQAFL